MSAGDTAATGDKYRDRCKDARSCSDVKNVPATRCSRDVFYNILPCEGDAVLDHVHAKLTSTKNRLKFLCWSEDSAGTWEQCVCRAVFSDHTCEDIVIKWHRHAGKKTGLEKAQAVKQVIQEFSKGRAPVVKAFEKCFAFQADGESAEPLAATFVKVENTLPLRHCGRCGMHSKQRNMENATETYPFIGSSEIITDITSTGKTLKDNNLRILKDGLILKSQACLYSSKKKAAKLQHFLNSLK